MQKLLYIMLLKKIPEKSYTNRPAKNITFVVLYLPRMPVVGGCFPLLKLRQTVEGFLLFILANLHQVPQVTPIIISK